MAMKLLLCLCTLTCSASFTTLLSTTSRPAASVVDGGRRLGIKTILWIGVNDPSPPKDDTTTDTVVPNDSSNTSSSPSPGGSDLKSLLPTPKRTTLTLDKFGRRIHDLKSDGTPKYSKGDVSSDMLQDLLNSDYDDDKSAPMKSDHDITNTKDQQEQNEVNSNGSRSSPSLAQLVGGKSDGSPTTTSGRSNAAVKNNSNNDAILGEGNVSVDLKALLPTQKMKFMKLDKFGRRIQRMEDDGTVNYSKEPSSPSTTTTTITKNNQPSTYPQSSSKIRGTKDGFDSDSEAPMVDLGEDTQEATTAARTNNNYGSLKELTTSIQRPTWTKLDFKGGSVVDERRMQQMNKKTDDDNTIRSDGGGGSVGGGGGGGGGGKSLQELLPKRATWTKLDFKGVPVEDERRTKKQSGSGSSSSSSSFNQGGYSSLKTLLPTRTITWHKNQVLSSGSAPTLSQVSRGLREERQQAMKDDVLASISAEGTNDDEDDGEEGMAAEEDDSIGEEEEVKAYQNLKDLLPQRKVTWRTTK